MAKVAKKRKISRIELGSAPAEDSPRPPETGSERKQDQEQLNIGVIGGGTRCKALLEMFEADRFKRLRGRIVAVADINPQAPGLLFAKEKGIYTTNDYRDFLHMESLDAVIELTGKEELLTDVLRHKRPDLRVWDYAISRLMSDMVTFRGEYKRQEEDVSFYRGVIKTLWAGFKEAIFLLKPDFQIVDANDTMLKLVGMSRDEVVGRTCHEISHRLTAPCNSASCQCPLRETLETGLSAHAIHEHLDRDKGKRYIEVTTFPLKNYLDQTAMVFEFCRDVTDELELRLEERTRQLKKDLARLLHEDKMIALGKLVASSVHEINNPIAGIHTLARLLLRFLDEGPPRGENLQEFQRYLCLISDESARCGHIVSNLLSFSRQAELERRLFNLNDLIRSVLLLVKHKMELQKITVEENLAADLPEIEGDRNQIQQCLMNLVFNAMESMPGGGKLAVTTSVDKSASRVQAAVTDTGCGIAPENISTIFEPFFSTKSPDKGVGLGLSVVYGIIREHRGTIYVDSTVGEGSTFTLTLPGVERPEEERGEG
jgi:two-component system, NtrC family, sensor kinase